MKHALFALMLAGPAFGALPAAAHEIPGLVSARLLPGWVADGQRFAALELVLEPGWKTYWRSPGDGGIPPRFEWLSGVPATGTNDAGDSDGGVHFYWPRPDVFYAAGLRSIGYHDRMLLPFSLAVDAQADDEPLRAEVDFGLCREVCVPASVRVEAPAPAMGVPDASISAAIADQPVTVEDPIPCRVEAMPDGVAVTAYLPGDAPLPAAAQAKGENPWPGAVVAEFADPAIWASEPQLSEDEGQIIARFEAIAPAGGPFTVEGGAIGITHLWDGGAVEYRSCRIDPAQAG